MSKTGTSTNLNLPPVSKLRQIITLLAGDTSNIGLNAMTSERQQTVLAASAAALLLAKYNNHTLTRDPLTRDERYMAAVSSVAEVTGAEGPSGLAFAAALLAWAVDLVTEGTRSDDGHHTPGPAIGHLLTAVQHLLSGYLDAHTTDGVELDGTVYRIVEGYAGTDEALREMYAATEMIRRLLPPKAESGPDAEA